MELKDLFLNGKWYHVIRHDGLVSNGIYDIDDHLSEYHFEADYRGQSVLDVGCADGFFSIWMKEHGAARVCGLDSNKYDGSLPIEPSNFNLKVYEKKYNEYLEEFSKYQPIYEQYGLKNANKFLLLSRLKGLEMEYRTGTIYDLEPFGKFDLVLCNDLLEHLRDPITAIEQLYHATAGKCIITVSSAMKKKWWMRDRALLSYQGHISGGSFFSLSEPAVIAMCRAAGFARVEVVSRFDMHNRRNAARSAHFVVHAWS